MKSSGCKEAQGQQPRRGWRRLFGVFGFLGTALIVVFALASGEDPSDAVRNAQRDDRQR